MNKKGMAEKKMKGSYILMEALKQEGVDTIFGYPGGNIIPVFDAFELTDNAEVQNYGTATIVVTAYAVQADGFNVATKTAVQNATDAWNAAFGNSSN